MTGLKPYSHFFAICVGALIYGSAQGDSVSDLQKALDRLEGQTPVKAELHAEVWSALGEGDERLVSEGEASVTLRDGRNRFTIDYDRELLAQLEAEKRARAKHPEASTPALDAVQDFRVSTLRPLVTATKQLRRMIDEADYRSEREDIYQGDPVRVLTFERDISTLRERDRKYIKSFESTLEVWVDEEGVPLKSRSYMLGKGRIFIFIRFEHMEEDVALYAVEGDRLVIVNHQHSRRSKGGGESHEGKVVKALEVLSTEEEHSQPVEDGS